MNSYQKGKRFEDLIEFIYQWLLKYEGETPNIKRNVRFEIDGVAYEIDIYYEFLKAGTLHKVAIECKDWKESVRKNELTNFVNTIAVMKGVVGIVVSRHGYTRDGKNLLNNNGIQALTLDNLPEFTQIIGLNLFKAYVPKPNDIAEPFYALLGVDNDGEWTGEYVVERRGFGSLIYLFLSRKHGNNFIKQRGDKNVAALPLKRAHINTIIDLSNRNHGPFKGLHFCLSLFRHSGSKDEPVGFVMTANQLRDEYLD